MSSSISEQLLGVSSGFIATAPDERKQRRRVQNRLNQRVHSKYFSLHLKKVGGVPEECNIASKAKTQRQYHIESWRLDEHQTTYHSPCLRESDGRQTEKRRIPVQSIPEQDSVHGEIQDAQAKSPKATCFPLPADHLLHLIKYNVFRGLLQNKALVESLMVQYHTPDILDHGFSNHEIFPNYTVIMPVAPDLSGSLTPTPVQMNTIHSTWINFLPFPTLRENLIKWEFNFDHADLIQDLVGDLINLCLFLSTSSIAVPEPVNATRIAQTEDEEPTATQTGLIVWGEPHLADNWEATPGFLQKWAWAVAGCQELMAATNRWRALRGEQPLLDVSITN